MVLIRVDVLERDFVFWSSVSVIVLVEVDVLVFERGCDIAVRVSVSTVVPESVTFKLKVAVAVRPFNDAVCEKVPAEIMLEYDGLRDPKDVVDDLSLVTTCPDSVEVAVAE